MKIKNSALLKNKRVILEKTELFAKKGGLKSTPKVKIKHIRGIASASFYTGNITLDEEFVSLWERGVFDDDILDFVLAHEIGHLIDYGNTIKDKLSSSHFKCLIKILIATIAALALMKTIQILAVIPLFILILFFRAWYIKPELEAYKNAVDFKLIGAKKLIISRHKIDEYYRKQLKPKGALHFWHRLWKYLIHPSITEIAQYLGIDISFEVKIKKSTAEAKAEGSSAFLIWRTRAEE
ncbi:MAG: hypothetical protein N3D12_00870 [Candidatus Methanomethyliaceae archaeon]|nr:hypothetical protein [Candidatus Methanomethyliaceae archaeon]